MVSFPIHDFNTDNVNILLIVPNFALIIGGYSDGNLDTVEVVSPDPISNPVPDCMKVLGNFPKKIRGAVGTTFGKLNQSYKILLSHSLLLLTRKCTSCVRRYRWRRQLPKPLLEIWRHTWSMDPCRQVSVMQCRKADPVRQARLLHLFIFCLEKYHHKCITAYAWYIYCDHSITFLINRYALKLHPLSLYYNRVQQRDSYFSFQYEWGQGIQ